MSAPTQRPVRGFTLVEMMMVLALAGVISVLAAPSMMSMVRRWNLGSTTRSFYAVVLDTQSRARSTGIDHRLSLDRAEAKLTILRMDSTSGTTVWQGYLESGLSPSSKVFGFSPSGYPSAFPRPYDTVPHDSWCTFCNDTSGYIQIDPQGLISASSNGTTSGSFALYDKTRRTDVVEALIYIGRTGDLRLFRNR
jgi:prepilin-type N-terminal cleavage/methylation domain-containing protein